MHYNQHAFVESVDAERRAQAARHRADLDAGVLAATAGGGAAWAALGGRCAGRGRGVTLARRLSRLRSRIPLLASLPGESKT